MGFWKRVLSGGKWIPAGSGPVEIEEVGNGYKIMYSTRLRLHTGTGEIARYRTGDWKLYAPLGTDPVESHFVY